MPEVVVIGDANVDIIVHYPKFKNQERTQVEYPTPEVSGGGTSSNTAAALAKLDVPTLFVGTIGDDPHGRFVLKDFADLGVDTSGITIDRQLNTIAVFAFVDEYGERYLWGWPRENQSFKSIRYDDVPIGRIRNATWIHSSGMSMTYDTSARETITRVFEEAHAAGIPTSFDLNSRIDHGVLDPGFEAALYRIIPHVNYLLGSGPDEFAYLGSGSWEENARQFVSDDCTVIARDGVRGSFAFGKNVEVSASAYSVRVNDTVGAGDVFNAGLIYALITEHSLEDALQIGNAVAAYAVTGKGARSSPTTTELEEFMQITPLVKVRGK